MIGDTADFASRLRRVLPDRWFPDDAPVLEALLAGMAQGWADLYAQLQTTALQSRLLTVSGSFLDLAVADFLGYRMPRRDGETDAQYRARFLPLFPEKVTRAALIARVQALTGHAPVVFEPANPGDAACYRRGYYGHTRYGSLSTPYQVFIDAQRPTTPDGTVHDLDIYKAVAFTIAAGITAWVRLSGTPPAGNDPDYIPGGFEPGSFTSDFEIGGYPPL